MARDYAAIHVSIWSDPHWRALPARLQHGYWLLLSQPRLSPCGVLDFIPRRFAAMASDLTVADVEALVRDLESSAPRPWVVHDEVTAELLVRSFVRHDGLIKGERPAKAIAKDFDSVSSPHIRQVIVDELRRHRKGEPKLKGWVGIAAESPELMALLDSPERPKLEVA